MQLRNVFIENQCDLFDIEISGDCIASIKPAMQRQVPATGEIYLNNAIAIPGLINSHDHLDFNLFPALGDRYYKDYREWAQHIHSAYKAEIDKVLAVPVEMRVQWGMYKNLLCGVTTVVNHGLPLFCASDIVDVFQHCQSLHSVGFEKMWRLKLNNPLRLRKSVAIHVGEGINGLAEREINKLLAANVLGRELIAVHGVAMNALQARKFKALVWCPASNYFMFNKTADINNLKHGTVILFGSDSVLTADWSMLRHIHLARRLGVLSDEELLQSLTTSPAAIWELDRLGKIQESYYADIVVADQRNKKGLDAALSITSKDILLVIKKGRVQLFDETLVNQILSSKLDVEDFNCIVVEGQVKYVRGNISQLIDRIRSYYPEASLPVKKLKPKEQINAYAS
ncbi:amidohydrolase family protein [Danxiaibacter flavus]|uniref:Amidohydrolase family protein n=1 Tax=Danxiaibacter flavus TaxID=3049108 RepID=A0ABV3Z971_9BACT|nr:amidohydrolase family protein [Chitinophagaceae bacterium DXS]